ncbi:unnamed protein product [Prorocentrum cordatum]|uniref:SH3 domain-containing protein n=1 Tax=Prorocentrum cordatum TaxID=2364126 RepID=A0ABN9PQ86_9DINO|nr:unnamed protein product [Polarella glacialis]
MNGGASANQSDQHLPKEPPDAQEERIRTVVVKPHLATDATQLSLQEGEIVIVLEQDESGWWGGHKDREEVTGWFPGSCVRQVQAEPMQWPDIDSVPNEVESPVGGEDSFGNQMKRCCAALEGEDQSPVQQHVRVRLVATPQRCSQASQLRASPPRESHPPTVDDLAASSTESLFAQPCGGADEQASERAELQRYVSELTDALGALRQQAESERARAAALESSLQEEQKWRRQLEQQLEELLQGDSAEKTNLRAEVGALRGLLDDERRQRREEVERLQERCDAALREAQRAAADDLRPSEEEPRRPSAEPAPERDARRRLFDEAPDHSRSHRGSQPVAHVAAPAPAGGGSGAGHGRPRTASAPGPGALRGRHSAVRRDEAPPPGCVAERVRALEQQRPSTPGAAGPAREWRASSYSSEDRRARRTPPVPRHCQAPSAGGAEACEEAAQVFLGMSPLGRGGQAAAAAALAPSPPVRLQQAEGGAPEVQPAGDGRLRLSSSCRGLASEAASERARVLQVW